MEVPFLQKNHSERETCVVARVVVQMMGMMFASACTVASENSCGGVWKMIVRE